MAWNYPEPQVDDGLEQPLRRKPLNSGAVAPGDVSTGISRSSQTGEGEPQGVQSEGDDQHKRVVSMALSGNESGDDSSDDSYLFSGSSGRPATSSARPSVPAYGDPAKDFPQYSQYVNPSDIGEYMTRVGQKPTPPGPQGVAGKALSILSDLFLHQDLPQEFRQAGYQAKMGQWQHGMDPVEARLAMGQNTLKAETERQKDIGLARQEASRANLFTTEANKPPAPAGHWYTADVGGKPVPHYATADQEPQGVLAEWQAPPKPETPNRNPADIAFEHLITPKEKGGAGMDPLAAYQLLHSTEGQEKPPHTLMVDPSTGKAIDVQPGSTVPKGARTPTEMGQINQQEQNRADLGENVNENLDRLEEIVGRRSDLFGKVAGRWTKFKEWTGTNDQDIAAMKQIEDNLGRAMTGAHGMRNGQLVEKASQDILNSYNNGPDAIKSAIKSARDSIKTFTADVESKGGSTGATGKSGGQWNPKTGRYE